MEMDSYLESRYNFVSELSEQTSLTSGESLYDKKGTISRAALLGIPKSQIEKVLEKNTIFRANKNLMSDSSAIVDPIEKAQLLKFKDFYQSLVDMEDLEEKVTIRKVVSERLSSKYSDIDAALFELDNGGSAKDIFDALLESPKWKDHAGDYLSKEYVELPAQKKRIQWSEFKEIVDLINDIKYFEIDS